MAIMKNVVPSMACSTPLVDRYPCRPRPPKQVAATKMAAQVDHVKQRRDLTTGIASGATGAAAMRVEFQRDPPGLFAILLVNDDSRRGRRAKRQIARGALQASLVT